MIMYKIYMFIPKKSCAHRRSSRRQYVPFLKVDKGLLKPTTVVVFPYQINRIDDTKIIGAKSPHYVSG
jgi:hypothetical protein